MIFDSIFACVLALVAVACVALAWIIFDLRREQQDFKSLLSTNASALRSCAAKLADVEKQTPTALVERVGELSEAVERLRLTHRRFAGRFDQFVSKREPTIIDGELDDELEATLRLQNAPSAGPGAR